VIDPRFLAKFRTVSAGRDEALREAKLRKDADSARECGDQALSHLREIAADNHARGETLRYVRAWIEEEERKAAAGEPADTSEARGAAALQAEVSAHNDAGLEKFRASRRSHDEQGRFVADDGW
jgi:hypothetical protein